MHRPFTTPESRENDDATRNAARPCNSAAAVLLHRITRGGHLLGLLVMAGADGRGTSRVRSHLCPLLAHLVRGASRRLDLHGVLHGAWRRGLDDVAYVQ